MPRSGGTYSLPSGNPVLSGSTISSTVHNNTLADIADALTASIAKDGQTPPTANLPMGGYRHTNVDDAAARTDYARADQVQDGALVYLTSVSGTNTITATAPLSMSVYAAGQTFRFIPANTNTGAATININSIGDKNIYRSGAALVNGELIAGAPAEIMYDGTQFNLINPRPVLELLASGAVSAASSLTFANLLAIYRQYIVAFDALAPASDSVTLNIRFSTNNGSSYLSGASDYAWAYTVNQEAGLSTNEGDSDDSEITLQGAIGSGAGETISGQITIDNPMGTGKTRARWHLGLTSATPTFGNAIGAGEYQTAAATNAVALFFSTGNIASMNYSLYGVRA